MEEEREELVAKVLSAFHEWNQTDACIYECLFYDRRVYQINKEGMDISLNSAGKITCLYGKKMKPIPHLTPNWQINIRQIKYLIGKGKM